MPPPCTTTGPVGLAGSWSLHAADAVRHRACAALVAQALCRHSTVMRLLFVFSPETRLLCGRTCRRKLTASKSCRRQHMPYGWAAACQIGAKQPCGAAAWACKLCRRISMQQNLALAARLSPLCLGAGWPHDAAVAPGAEPPGKGSSCEPASFRSRGPTSFRRQGSASFRSNGAKSVRSHGPTSFRCAVGSCCTV